jgi:hypothetical protein
MMEHVEFIADYALTFAKLIARTAKDTDTLIDSLPSEESSLKVQVTFFVSHKHAN